MARFLRKDSWVALGRKVGLRRLPVLLPWREAHRAFAGGGGGIGANAPQRTQHGSQYDSDGISDLQDHHGDERIEQGARRALRRDAYYRDDHGAQQNQHEKREPHERAAECAKRKESNPDPVHLSGSPVLPMNP
jgi:hypothetical protein